MIPVAYPDLTGNERRYVDDCVASSWVSSVGRYIGEFEQEFAKVAGSRHVIATNNGTTALHLALAALGIGPGDEVVVPALTYIATANAVRYCGATPVLADVEEDTMNLDPADLERKVTDRTRAVIPVHLYGHPADMTGINAVAERHGLRVIEDAAEAHGAKVNGRPVGSLAHLGSFSFFGNKILTTGEGGAVTTDDDDLAARLRLLRGQGMDPNRRYWFPEVGFNYRMTNIQAALGVAQLERFDAMLARRAEIQALYDELFADDPRLALPVERPDATRVNWLYTLRVVGLSSDERNTLIEAMAADGVETRPVFYPLHLMPPYQGEAGAFPVSERVGAEGISLPTHMRLTDEDVRTVASCLLRNLATLGR
jgi:perosamine synthetase